ncbi:MAG: hypothetical protein H5U04_12390 [Firmicutes bacterium]|nr:hypothetical protein [Bacillota bacterium]
MARTKLHTCPICKQTVNLALDEYHVHRDRRRARYYHLPCWQGRERESEWVRQVLNTLRA